jgi:hypothetical protein
LSPCGDWISVSGFNEEFQRDFARWRLARQGIDQMLVSSLEYLGFSPGCLSGCPPLFASNVRTTRDGRRSRERANTRKDAAISVVRNQNMTRSGLAKLTLAHPFSSCASAATIAVTGSTLHEMVTVVGIAIDGRCDEASSMPEMPGIITSVVTAET